MRCIFLVLFALWIGLAPAVAQTGAAPPAPAAQSETEADALIRLLEDDAARAALIARLRASAPAEAAGAPAAAAASPAVEDPTFARQIAEYTRAAAERAAGMAQLVLGLLRGLDQGLDGVAAIELGALWQGALNILLVGAVMLGVGFVLRLGLIPLTGRLARRAETAGWLLRLLLLAAAVLADALGVVLAWAAGYAFALNWGAFGQMGINQTLLLNAVLAVEGLKVLLRAALMPQWPALRPIPFGEQGARIWYFWLSRAVSLIGYTFMFLAPVLNASAAWAATQPVRVAVMLGMAVAGILAVLRHRRAGQHWIEQRRRRASHAEAGLETPTEDPMGRVQGALAHGWHLLAILYILAIFATWMTDPRGALGFMLAATLRSAILLVVGSLLLRGLRRLLAGGICLPQDWQERLPALQPQLNTLIPTTLRVVRSLVLLALVLALLQIWGAVDFLAWLETDRGRRTLGAFISAGVILLVGAAVYLAVTSWVEYRLNPNFGSVPSSRERTLLSLFRNAFSVALVVVVGMLALSELGVNIGPLLAGAGVLGLAIGFGAQKLVQDIITGVFIQFENAMNVGDVVTLSGVTGSVEKLTIRSVTLRGGTGTVHVIPFSSVSTVANNSRGFGVWEQKVEVAYGTDVEAVKAALQEAFTRLQATPHAEALIAPLDYVGIMAFGPNSITLQANIKTLANKQWGPGRSFSALVKQVFEERGIGMSSFPQMAVMVNDRPAARSGAEEPGG